MLFCKQQQPKDYQSEYLKIYNQEDNNMVIGFLNEWKEMAPDDPEMYVAHFNYYLQRSKTQVLKTGSSPQSSENVQITDPKNDSIGYIFPAVEYDEDLYLMAMKFLDEGIDKHPKRLDMYFGKIFTLGERKFFDQQKDVILELLDQTVKIDHQWLWQNSAPVSGGVETFKGGIQDHVYNLFNQIEPKCDLITTISKKFIEIFPNEVSGYSNLGSCALVAGDFDAAIVHFRKAESINAGDVVVLGNIAMAYLKSDRKDSARLYFERVAQFGDEAARKFALNKISELGQ